MDFKNDIDNECAHNLDNDGDFCSPYMIVDKLKTVLSSPETLVNDKDIKEKLKEELNCETEACILQHPKVAKIIGSVENIIEEYFKPEGPRDNNKWFSNTDIDSVLAQIQKKFTTKHFLHIPFQMIDFEKTQTELATLDWPAKYNEGFRTFGTVFNTDNSRGSGKHWFAIYCSFEDDSDEFTIEYFNSSGELPMKQISMWIPKVKVLWQPHFKKPINDIIVTRIVNQQDNWNCGSYSLYYIISRLSGTPYSYFKNTKIGDHNMQEFRKYLFRASN